MFSKPRHDSFPKSVYDFHSGLLAPHEYRYRMAFDIITKIRYDNGCTFIENEDPHTQDMDIQNNWLLATHSPYFVSIYDMTRVRHNIYKCLTTWQSPCHEKMYPLECGNWGRDCKYFTVTGRTNKLFVVDTATSTTVDEVKIPVAVKIYQHKPHPQNQILIAVATMKTVPLVDLRTGNIAITVKKHKNKVRSVAWSPVNEYLLATATESDIQMWDTRRTKESLKLYKLHVSTRKFKFPLDIIVPQIQFFPGTNILFSVAANHNVQTIDGSTFSSTTHFSLEPIQPFVRYKAALIGFSDPPLVYMPMGILIKVFAYTKQGMLRYLYDLRGHVFCPRTVVYNELLNEIYSASRDDGLAWVTVPR